MQPYILAIRVTGDSSWWLLVSMSDFFLTQLPTFAPSCSFFFFFFFFFFLYLYCYHYYHFFLNLSVCYFYFLIHQLTHKGHGERPAILQGSRLSTPLCQVAYNPKLEAEARSDGWSIP